MIGLAVLLGLPGTIRGATHLVLLAAVVIVRPRSEHNDQDSSFVADGGVTPPVRLVGS